VGKPEGKRSLGRPRHMWEDDIKMDLKRDRMRWYGLDSSGSGYGPVMALVNMVMDLQVP
jgi:hypothetical protein